MNYQIIFITSGFMSIKYHANLFPECYVQIQQTTNWWYFSYFFPRK